MCTKMACHSTKYTNEISQRQRNVSEGELTDEIREFAVGSRGDWACKKRT